jgi:hypothetical protein
MSVEHALRLHPRFYVDSDESFALYFNNLIHRYKDYFLNFAITNKGQLIRAFEDEKGQNLTIEAWSIDEFLTTVPENDHSHAVVRDLVPRLTGEGAECIALVIDMHHNCNAVYIKKVER